MISFDLETQPDSYPHSILGRSAQQDDSDESDESNDDYGTGWRWLDPSDYPSRVLRELMVQWWLEDIAGGHSYTCPPTPPRRVRALVLD